MTTQDYLQVSGKVIRTDGNLYRIVSVLFVNRIEVNAVCFYGKNKGITVNLFPGQTSIAKELNKKVKTRFKLNCKTVKTLKIKARGEWTNKHKKQHKARLKELWKNGTCVAHKHNTGSNGPHAHPRKCGFKPLTNFVCPLPVVFRGLNTIKA